MGYDLHITRRSNWAEEANDISSDEWLSVIASDPELKLHKENGPFFAIWSGKSTLHSPWLDWYRGQISTKNPDDALIDKMVEIARKLDAVVQGDDGEIYQSAKDAHPRPTENEALDIYRRLFAYYFRRFGRWITKWFTKPIGTPPPFRVGDRVVTSWGEVGVVKAIDRRAEHGHGTVSVSYVKGTQVTHILDLCNLSRYSGQEDSLRDKAKNH